MRHGRWVQAEGVVYEGWDAAVHVIDRFPVPADWPRYWSVDFGFTNPLVIQWWAQAPTAGCTSTASSTRPKRWSKTRPARRCAVVGALQPGEIRDWSRATEPKPKQILCDHDAEDRATLERHLRMQTTAAHKDVSPGIQAVAARLRKAGDGRPRLFILRDSLMHRRDPALVEAKKPTCTADELDGYCWDTANNRKHGEEPLKQDDHGCDGMRYAVAALDLNPKRKLNLRV